MILEIRLENFYSIKEEILLDFRAAKLNNKEANALSSNVINYNGQKILKSIGLFGANASGKSNILTAINFCSYTILHSHLNNEGSIFNFIPFKFENYIKKPSSFFINFIHNNIEYDYTFSLTTTEIITESLYYYPNGRKVKVFTRDETKGSKKQQIYSFSDGLIPRPFDVATNTSNKTLFLNRASQMDRDFCKILYQFFLRYFYLGLSPLDYNKFGLENIPKIFNENKDFFLHALSICDSDIIDIKLTLEEIKRDGTINDSIKNIKPYINRLRFDTYHKAAQSIPFDLSWEESAGTKQLFNMLFLILNVIKDSKTLMIDEFDSSLHSKIAEFVIDLFHASSSAQFLFTTHNTNLIDIKRFRKDQILFANKKDDGSTELYSLFDYKDFRENMDAEKGYLQGRFDAIPNIDDSINAIKKLLGEK